MFDFDALDQLERGLQEAETLPLSDGSSSVDAVAARADYLLDLSYALHKRSKNARIDGLHG